MFCILVQPLGNTDCEEWETDQILLCIQPTENLQTYKKLTNLLFRSVE